MIIKDRFGFVISRDGYILSTNFVQSIFSAAMIQYGPLATTDCHHYVFPLGGKVKSNVEADLVFAAIGHINQMLKWNTAGQERANVGKTRLEKMAKVNKDLVAMRETYIKKLNEYRHPVTKKIEHYAVTLDADGIIAERTVSYELDAEFPQDKRYYRNERSIYLPIGPGSEWAISTEAASTTLSAKDATVIRSINYLDLFYGSIVCESKPFPGELDLVEFYAVKGFLFTLEPGQRISRRSRSKKTLTCEEVVIGKFSSLTRFGKLQEISFNKNTDIVTMAEILLGDHLKCDITSSDIIAVGNDPLNVSFV